MNRFQKMLFAAFSLIILESLLAFCFPMLRTSYLILLGCEVLILIILPILKNHKKRNRIKEHENVFNGNFIQLDYGKVRYKLTGNKNNPTVILINGFPMPYEIWERNAEELVRNNYRVLQFDLWGFGYSDCPRTRFDVDLYCSQIQQLIHQLNIREPIHVVAFSIGCTIAGRIVEEFSNLNFGKFVFIGPVVSSISISPFNWPIIGEYLTSLFIQNAMLNIFHRNFYQKTGLEAFQDVFFEQLTHKGFKRAWLSFYRNLFPKASVQVYNKLATMGIPVSIISGKEDKIVSLNDSLLLHRKMGWKLTIVENGGHSVQYECAEVINFEILKFLKEERHSMFGTFN